MSINTSLQKGFKVGYIMSWFPKITETFILYEMIALEEQGIQVELYPLMREKSRVIHPEAVPFIKRAHFQRILSSPLLKAQIYFLLRKPIVYLNTLWTLIRSNWGSPRYLIGALNAFPRAVYFSRSMAKERVLHVHAHFASHPAVAAFVIHRLIGIPYSFTAHGSDLHRDRHMLCEKVFEASFVVSISEYNRQIILSECRRQCSEKVVKIHCGVDMQAFQPRNFPTPYEQGKSPFSILCIGTLHEVKGQTFLIEACRLLQARGIDFLCHFVGDGPDQNKLEKQAEEAGIRSKIVFHGRLNRQEVIQHLHQVDVLVAPSIPTCDGRREGIPVVLMEAMGCGLPVVASDISGIPELVEDGNCGLLVPPGDAETIANTLQRLVIHPDLRSHLGCAGREKVEREFDLKKNTSILARYFTLEKQL